MALVDPVAVDVHCCTQVVDLAAVACRTDPALQVANAAGLLTTIGTSVSQDENGLLTYSLISTQREWLQKGQSNTVSSLGLGFGALICELFFFAIGQGL